MERVRITEKSVGLTGKPGRYYVMVSPIDLSDAWQVALLKMAQEDAAGHSLGLEIEGPSISYQLLKGKTPAQCEQIIQGFMDQVVAR